MTRREKIIVGVAMALAIAWFKAFSAYRNLAVESTQLCSWPDAHLESVTWRGPVQITEGR